jgi:hypothetical protein
MSVEEITGREFDPGCLHCVLAREIGKFIEEHNPEDVRVITDLVQIAAEYIASVAPCPDRVAAGAARRLETMTAEMFATLRLAGKR